MKNYLHKYSNPSNLSRLLKSITPWCLALLVLGFPIGLYLSFVYAPIDYQQGESVRIMFVHVPAAWWASAIFFAMAINSFMFIIRRHKLWSLVANSLAPAGFTCALVALVTGAIWGGPTWGTHWQWGDARIITTLVLAMFYLSYVIIPFKIENNSISRRVQAYIALIGSLNLPLIRFSVDWWQTLHQPASVIRSGGASMHSSFLYPLLFMVALVAVWCLVIFIFNLRRNLYQLKIERIISDISGVRI